MTLASIPLLPTPLTLLEAILEMTALLYVPRPTMHRFTEEQVSRGDNAARMRAINRLRAVPSLADKSGHLPARDAVDADE